jgi:hypothetical protein
MILRRTRVNWNRPRKPVSQITDRAKRYRANSDDVRPGPPKACGFCGARRTVEVHHVDGNEDNGEPENLMWACRSCNTRVAFLMAANGLGKRTRQYNGNRRDSARNWRLKPLPRRGNPAALKGEMAKYAAAIKVMRGEFPGDVSAAVQTIHDTSPATRSAYTARTWSIRRARYGASGRQTEIPF